MSAVRARIIAVTLALSLAAAHAATIDQLMDSGHWRQARTAVDADAKAHPDDARTLYLESRIKLAYGDAQGALPLIEKALEKDPSKADYHGHYADVLGTLVEHVSFFKQMSMARTIKRELETVISMEPNNVEARAGLIRFHQKAPGIVGGDKKQIPVLLDQITKINPARGYLEQAQLAIQDKDRTKAGAMIQKAVEADPRSYPARVSLANWYSSPEQKNYAEAERQAREAIKLDPQRVAGWAALAVALASQDKWADLDTALAGAEQANPGDFAPHYAAARVMVVTGKELGRAEKLLRRYLTQEPEPGSPPLAGAHWRLGQLLEKQGRKDDALKEYETAVHLAPNLEDAKKDLKRLKG
jgi:tetratricopeptide (TPR) repeat protein